MRASGVTLIELLAVIVALGVLLGVGVPSLQRMLQDNRLATTVNELSRALAFARSEAVTRGRQIVLCKSPDGRGCRIDGGWEQGWMAFVDPGRNEACPDLDLDSVCDDDGGEIILVRPGSSGAGLSISASGNPRRLVAFNPIGFANGYAGTFSICDARGIAAARGLVISMIGRIRVATAGDNLSC